MEERDTTYLRNFFIYIWLLRHSTARGTSFNIVTVRPTKVKACKSILFTEDKIKYSISRVLHERDSMTGSKVAIYIFNDRFLLAGGPTPLFNPHPHPNYLM